MVKNAPNKAQNADVRQEVSLSELGQLVRWSGDNLGCDMPEWIAINDDTNNTCRARLAELLAHNVWQRLDGYSRRRIEAGLKYHQSLTVAD